MVAFLWTCNAEHLLVAHLSTQQIDEPSVVVYFLWADFIALLRLGAKLTLRGRYWLTIGCMLAWCPGCVNACGWIG